MNDNSPQKVRKLHQFIKHHNAPYEPPRSRRWWLVTACTFVIFLMTAGVICLVYGRVSWRDWIPSTSSTNLPAADTIPIQGSASEGTEEDALAERLHPKDQLEAYLRLVATKDESVLGPSITFLNQQAYALCELARRFPEDERVATAVVEALDRDGLREAGLRALLLLEFRVEAASEPLARLVNADDREVGAAALKELIRIDPFRACAIRDDIDHVLMNLLRSGNAQTRLSAVYCLGARRFEHSGAVSNEKLAGRLGLLLDDEDKNVARAAAMVLSDLGEAGVKVVVDRWTPPANPNLRHRSQFHELEKITDYEMWILARGGKASLPAASAVMHELGEIRRQPLAPHALIRMGPGAAEQLTRSAVVHEPILDAWGAEAIPTFLAGLDSPHSSVVENSAANLAYLGEPAKEALPKLIKLLDSKDSQMRWGVIRQLRGFGPLAKDAIPALEAVNPRELHERRSIAATIYCLDPSPRRLETCQAYLAPAFDRESEERSRAQSMRSDLRPSPPELWLEVMEKAWDGDDRRAAAYQLILNRDSLRPVPSKLFDLLRHEKDYVRSSAAWVIEYLGEPAVETAPALIKMTGAAKREERISAINALAAIGAYGSMSEVIAAVEACKMDGQGIEKKAAEYALRRIESDAKRRHKPQVEDGNLLEFVLSDNQAYLARAGAPPHDRVFVEKLPPAFAAEFKPAAWQAEFKQAQGKRHDYYNFPRALVYEPGRHGKLAASAVPYLWSAVNEAGSLDDFDQTALLSLWRITHSRLVLYAMIERQQIIPAIAEESLAKDLILVPPLISFANYRELLALPLPNEAKEAAWPFLQSVRAGPEQAWAAATLWHLKRDPRAIELLENDINWEVNEYSNHEQVAWALGFIGPPARRSIPRLAQLVYEGKYAVSEASAAAIRRIDRSALLDFSIP